MEDRKYKVDLYLYDRPLIINPIEFYQNDTESCAIEFNFNTDRVNKFDLTNKTVEVRVTKPDLTVISDSATITGLNTAVWELKLGAISMAGSCSISIYVYENTERLTFGTLKYKVKADREVGNVVSQPEYPILTDLIGDVQSAVNESNQTNDNISVMEQQRATNEQQRQQNETTRNSEFNNIKSEYSSIKGIMIDTNNAANLQNQVNQVNTQLADKMTFHASKLINKLKSGEPATIVFLGDSTTEQNATTNGLPNHVGLLTTWLESLYPGLVTVVNSGISGHNITMMLERLHKDVISKNPDLVIACSGINDQGGTYNIPLDEFRKNYNVLVQEIISQSDTDIILRTPNVVMSAATSDAINVYNDVTRAIAKRYNLGLFDLYKVMKDDIAKGVINLTTTGPFLKDSVHPNENGHAYIFEHFKVYFQPTDFVQKPIGVYKMISAKGGGFRNVGGTEFAGVSYVNGYTLLFNQPNKKINFEYEGEDLTVIYGMTAGTGQFIVYIDGVAQPLVDTYSATTKYRGSVTYSVPSGKHLIEIECQSTKNDSSSSTNLQIQAVIFKKENRINYGLIPLAYSYLNVVATTSVSLTPSAETTLIYNSVPANIGDVATVNVTTGEITMKKAGLYQIISANRVTTDADKSIEVNYKVNGTTIKRFYSRTTTSTVTPQTLSVELLDFRVLNVGDVIKFAINSQGTAPTSISNSTLIKIG